MPLDLLNQLSKVPDTIWAAIIASLLTIGGVVLTNLNSRKQQKEALVHDSNQRDREREMSLRKEVYMPAIEAISAFHGLFSRLPDLNLAEREYTSAVQSNSGAIGKIHVIASNETVQSVMRVQQVMTMAFLRSFPIRASLISRKAEIDEFTGLIEQSIQEEVRIIELMKQYNIDGNTDDQRWKMLNENVDFEMKRHSNYEKRKQELLAEQNPALLAFAKDCFDETLKIAELIPHAILAIRKELSLPLDENIYLEICKGHVQNARDVFYEFMNKTAK
jgi:hypothetical protein